MLPVLRIDDGVFEKKYLLASFAEWIVFLSYVSLVEADDLLSFITPTQVLTVGCFRKAFKNTKI